MKIDRTSDVTWAAVLLCAAIRLFNDIGTPREHKNTELNMWMHLFTRQMILNRRKKTNAKKD